MATAMQFIGYRRVIATIWTITDSAALRVSDIVYEMLTDTSEPNSRRMTEAVHLAIASVGKRTRRTYCYGGHIFTSAYYIKVLLIGTSLRLGRSVWRRCPSP